MSTGQARTNYKDFLYIRRRYITKDQLRAAVRPVVNAIFRERQVHIWGEGSTACASDSKKFGVWDQNLLTEWHARYGGRGVMIYWHVDCKSTCIYSQLKRCSSSEAAAMIEGVLRHTTMMSVEQQYVASMGRARWPSPFAGCSASTFYHGSRTSTPRDSIDRHPPPTTAAWRPCSHAPSTGTSSHSSTIS